MFNRSLEATFRNFILVSLLPHCIEILIKTVIALACNKGFTKNGYESVTFCTNDEQSFNDLLHWKVIPNLHFRII